MSSNALQIGSPWQNGSPGFAQTGQVDWVAFGNTLWSTSSAVLQRFASAGVQPVTYGAVLALASQFQLDRVGKQRMHNALKSLHGVAGLERLLWFGFGVRSFVQVMADTDMGVKCVALCSCLVEVHGEDASAWILEELWRLHGYPQEYLPSHSQFTALVKACAGVLTRTSFSRITDRMLGHMLDADATRILPHISNIEDVAKAIQGLFRMSRGVSARISVIGGVECAFIAALASWLFNFRVYIEDISNTVIYSDASREEARLVVTYCGEAELSLVRVSSTTYILHGLDDLFIRNPKLDQILLTFRTPWDGCLARVFGVAFDRLISLPHILGCFLGSAARVYSGLAKGERDVGPFSRKTFINFVEAAHGRGFVTAAISIFPELSSASNLLETMQKATDASMEEALRAVEQTTHNLAQSCGCYQCTSVGIERKASCLLNMALSIRAMVSTISCTVRDPELLPTIRGIQMVYNELSNERGAIRTSNVPFLSLALGLMPEEIFVEICDAYQKIDLLSHPVELFSGHSHHSRYFPDSDLLERDTCTALVRQGLCYYLDCLRSTTSQAEMVRMVHILPGHIQMGDRQFDNIFDPATAPTSPSLAAIQYDMVEEHNSSTMIEEPRSDSIKLEARGLEKSAERDLVAYYQVSIPGEPTIQLKPGLVARKILMNTSMLTCARTRCSTRLALPCGLIREGWRTIETLLSEGRKHPGTDHVCFIWPPMSDVARCVVISQHGQRETVFLRRQECTSCCTTYVVCQGPRPGHLISHIL